MYNIDYISETSNSVNNFFIWTIIAFIISIATGILIYYLFLKDTKPVSENVQKLKDILNFKTMIIEPILKIVYLITTIFIILYSFSFIAINFAVFLGLLILGPIVIRISYEIALILVMIWKNTKEINENLKAKSSKKEKVEKEPKEEK